MSGCSTQVSNEYFESNIAYSQIDEKCKIAAEGFELSIIYYFYNESKIRTEYKVLGMKGNQWTKLLFYSDLKGNFQKTQEKLLSEQDGRIAILSLDQYDLFNITPQDVLLKEHRKLCGKPRDPSHYLEYNLVLVSGKTARKVQFSNPDGRFAMCPAIRQWENAAKISEYFNSEWGFGL